MQNKKSNQAKTWLLKARELWKESYSPVVPHWLQDLTLVISILALIASFVSLR